MSKAKPQQTFFLRSKSFIHKRFHNASSSPPTNMKSRNGITMPRGRSVTALSPTDHKHQLNTELSDVSSLLFRRKFQVGLCPLSRPIILLAVKPCSSHPVLPSQFKRILDAHATLLR